MATIDVRGARLAFEERGTDAPSIVFVHGGGCARDDWAEQFDALSAHCRVVAFDLRGHGASTVAQPSTCNVETFAADLLAVIAATGAAPAVLVGHSLGCRIVLEANRCRPSAVLALVLVDGNRRAAGGDARYGQAIMDALSEGATADVLARWFSTQLVGRRDPAVRATALSRLESIDEETFAAMIASSIRWDVDVLESALAAVVAPTLVVQSTETLPDGSRRSLEGPDDSTAWLGLLRTHLADIETAVVADVGHFCMLEAPDEVTSAIAGFIDRRVPAQRSIGGSDQGHQP